MICMECAETLWGERAEDGREGKACLPLIAAEELRFPSETSGLLLREPLLVHEEGIDRSILIHIENELDSRSANVAATEEFAKRR